MRLGIIEFIVGLLMTKSMLIIVVVVMIG